VSLHTACCCWPNCTGCVLLIALSNTPTRMSSNDHSVHPVVPADCCAAACQIIICHLPLLLLQFQLLTT
jgi:hypothetical protein